MAEVVNNYEEAGALGVADTHQMAAVREALERDGVAVLPGVMTPEECAEQVTDIRHWLGLFGHSFPDNMSSIIHKYSISHGPAAWAARLRAAPVFAQLWGTEKLATSLDGMAIGQPPEEAGAEWPVDGLGAGLHLDQGGGKHGLHAYQGALYFEEALEEDWCFQVLNGSHKHHADFFARPMTQQERRRGRGRKRRSEFLKLTLAELDWYETRGCPVRRVGVPRGGLLLWDSRTVHAGAPPLPRRANEDRWRYVSFVCMVPAAWCSPQDAASRRNAYHRLLTSAHWPADGFRTFRSGPGPSALCAVTSLPAIARTEKVRLLVGDLDYDFEDGKPNGPSKPVILHTE